MKAIQLHSQEKGLQYTTVDQPKAEKDNVLVKLSHSALNRRDLWIAKGKYAGIKYPMILGSDGFGVDENGNEVIICPSSNWGHNEDAQGIKFEILGLPKNGTFAEYISIDRTLVFPAPKFLKAEENAALPLTGLTAYRALFSRAKIQANQKVLITGIGGGVALIALQFAKAFGAEVYVTSSSDDKIEKAIKLGAKGGGNYKSKDWEQQFIFDHGEMDVIIDGAAGDGLNQLLEVCTRGGTIVNYGATAGTINQLSPRLLFWKQINLLGTTMGSPKEFKKMLDFVNQHYIAPIVDEVIPLSEAQRGFDKIEDSKQFGKVIFNNIK